MAGEKENEGTGGAPAAGGDTGGAENGPEIVVEIEGEASAAPASGGAPASGDEGAPEGGESGAEGGDEEGDGEPADGQPPRRRGPHKRRTGAYWQQKAREQQETAQRLADENTRLKSEMDGAKVKLTEADKTNWAHYEARVTAELAAAEKAAEEAIAGGDPKTIAAANKMLAMKASEQGQIDAWKASQPKVEKKAGGEVEKPNDGDGKQVERQPMRAAPNPVRDAWIASNPWFDNRADEFDPEMQQEAVSYAQIVERRLIRQGRENEVGKKTYFEEINKHMTQEFPDVFQNTRRMPNMSGGGNVGVAPPVRGNGGAGGGGGSGSSIKIKLTAEQRDFAINNARNGAVKGPNGEKLTDDQAVARFARKIHEDQLAQKAQKTG